MTVAASEPKDLRPGAFGRWRAQGVALIADHSRRIRRSPSEMLGLALTLLAIAAIGWRLVGLKWAPFIADEPLFLTAALQQQQDGWVSHAPLPGTHGTHYGPSVMWFYGVVQRVFGSAPLIAIAAMCAFVSFAHVVLAAALTRAFKGGLLSFGTLLLLLGSSPYQFFWSRLAWDQLVNALSAICLVLLSLPGPVGYRRAACLGALLGVAISSHPMVGLFAGGVGVALAVESYRQPRRLALLAVAGIVPAVVINLPWLLYLIRTAPSFSSTVAPVDVPLLSRALDAPRVWSVDGIQYFFDGDWALFQAFAGNLTSSAVAEATFWVVAGCFALGMVAAAFGAAEARRLLVCAGAVLVAYPIFYWLKQIHPHPHYQFPTYAAVCVGLASACALSRRRRLFHVVTVALVVVAITQLAFIARWRTWIAQRGGTGGIHYSVAIGVQTSAIREICRRSAADMIVVSNSTGVRAASLSFIARTEPDCAGKAVEFCGMSCMAKPGAALMRLRYEKYGVAFLAVDGPLAFR